MKWLIAFILGCAVVAQAQPVPPDDMPPGPGFGPPEDGPGFDNPPPFAFQGGGMRGPGGFGGVRAKTELVKQFDKNGDKWLNSEERRAAREYLRTQGNNRQGGPGGRRGGFGPRGENSEPVQAGQRVSPAEAKSFAGAPFYASNVVRTIFLEFENADWEKEMEDFHNTDVDVPAKMTVDGKTYADVGIHFRGASSYMMIGTGHKRSLSLSMDYVHDGQQVGGYRTLNLLNSHEDPTFLRSVLGYQIARDYLPAPKANWVRVVINGESWGLYVNVQQFNKDFLQEWFGTRKGARWKVPGSPNGRGGLSYLGEEVAAYKRLYQIKTKDEPKAWADFIKLCKVLNETPAEKLGAALSPLLDIDGALKFLALENVMLNNDGYWTRASDYDIYEDEKGRFHIIPYDYNESFSLPGGPGPGGPGGRGGFAPGGMVARQMFLQADKNDDRKLSKEEFLALADGWFDKLDPEKSGKVTQEQFAAKIGDLLPSPQGPQGFGPRGGRGGFNPAGFLGRGLFTATDANKDGSLTRAELKDTFAKWFGEWNTDKSGALDEEKLQNGLTAALPRPDFGGPGGFGGMGGRRGGGGGGFGPRRINGVELDPLVAVNDSDKPLISKLLAVPSLRQRYLGYVRDIAEKWLDWQRLGPLVAQYQALIADEVKADTRKLSSYEAFQTGLSGNTSEGARVNNLKAFAEQRRAYLLKYTEAKKAER